MGLMGSGGDYSDLSRTRIVQVKRGDPVEGRSRTTHRCEHGRCWEWDPPWGWNVLIGGSIRHVHRGKTVPDPLVSRWSRSVIDGHIGRTVAVTTHNGRRCVSGGTTVSARCSCGRPLPHHLSTPGPGVSWNYPTLGSTHPCRPMEQRRVGGVSCATRAASFPARSATP